MAQIIKHRRGSLEALSAVTSSLQKGEIVIATGSSNLTTTNGTSLVFTAPEAGQVQAVNRFLMGNSNPATFAGSTYNGMVNGVPYYASGSATLFLLGSDANTAINLIGNIQPFSTSVDSRLDALELTVGGGENGSLGARVIGLESKTGSYATTGSNTFDGEQTINNNIILGSDGQIRVESNTASTLFGHYDGSNILGAYYQMWGNNHASTGQRGGAEFVFDTRNGGTLGFNIAEYNGTTWIRKFGVDTNGAVVTGSLNVKGEISGSTLNGIGNVAAFSQSVDSRFNNLESYSGSNDNTNTAQNARLTSLETFSGSQESKNTTLATYTASVDSHITNVNSFTSSASGRLTNLESYTSSNDTTNTAQNSRLTSLETYTGSNDAKHSTLATYTASVDSHITNVNTFTASADGRLDNLESYSSSNDTTNTAQNIRLTSLESATGSYAKLSGGNVFTGTQTITGSLYITNDLIVQGSSSLQNITASAVDIGTNTIILNTNTPAVRFAGINVVDSGSTGATGSLLWDSLNNHWLYVHPSGAGEGYNSAILISGPKNTGSVGEETTLTNGYIPVAVGEDHIDNSIISQSGGNKITIAGGLDVIGNISGSIVGIGNVAAFSQSVDSRLDSVEASLGGGGDIGSSVTQLNAFTGSQEAKNSTLATYTASVDSRLSQLETDSGSQDGRLDVLETKATTLATYTASVDSHISNINAFTASQQSKDTTLETYTASVNSRLDQLSTDSGSQNTRITDLENKATTLQTYTASVNSRLDQLSTDSGSQNTRITDLENKAGTLATYTASVDSHISNVNTFTASVNGHITDINSYTQSANIKFSNLESTTASFANRITALETDTGSQDGRLDVLESKADTLGTYTASVNSHISAVNTFTSSTNGRLNNLEAFTSSTYSTFSTSVDSRLDVLEGTGTIQGLGQGDAVTFASINSVGNLTVGGDLVVEGNTVTLHTSELVVEDKLITLASGSTDAATANGAGIEIAGANATIKYNSSKNVWTTNIPVSASAFTGSLNVPGGASSKRIAFRNTNDNIDFVTAPTTSGDLLQWDGSDFVMSNVIDGGSF